MPSAFTRRGHFYTYPHSIVPTDLGIRLNGQLFIYAAIGLLDVSKGMFFILLMRLIVDIR